jgi:hypothetical protein
LSAPRAINSALYGVRQLLKFKLEAWAYFDKTLPGFWASYLPAVILAPFLFAHELYQFSTGATKLNLFVFILIRVLAYIISWTLFPFVMLYVVQLLQRSHRYFWHLVPYNWLQLPVGLVLYSIYLLTDAGVLPVGVAGYAQLAALVVTAVYGTFIAGVGLQVTTGTALSLVVFDLVLGMISSELIARIN